MVEIEEEEATDRLVEPDRGPPTAYGAILSPEEMRLHRRLDSDDKFCST